MYTTGDSCTGTLMTFTEDSTVNDDCSNSPITARFFYNWTGGSVYEMTHNGNSASTLPGIPYYITYYRLLP